MDVKNIPTRLIFILVGFSLFGILFFPQNASSQVRVYLINNTDGFGEVIRNDLQQIFLRTYEDEIAKIQKKDISYITPLYAKVTIIDGYSYSGKVTELSSSNIELQTDFELYKFKKSEVLFFEPIHENDFIENSQNQDYQKFNNRVDINNHYYNTYPQPFSPIRPNVVSFGASVGYGGFPNFHAIYNSNNIYPTSLQIGLMLFLPNSFRFAQHFRLSQSPQLSTYMSFSLGYIGPSTFRDNYRNKGIVPFGLNYEVNFKNYFFELGIAHNLSDSGGDGVPVLGFFSIDGASTYMQFQFGYKFDI